MKVHQGSKPELVDAEWLRRPTLTMTQSKAEQLEPLSVYWRCPWQVVGD